MTQGSRRRTVHEHSACGRDEVVVPVRKMNIRDNVVVLGS